MAKKPKRTIAVVLSDTHGSYHFGVMPPDVVLPKADDFNGHDDEQPLTEKEEVETWLSGWYKGETYTPKQTKTQAQLYDWFMEDRSQVIDLAGKDDIYVLHIGDVVQGNAIPRQQTTSPRLIDQLLIAEQTMARYADLPNCKGGRLIKGTTWHTFNHGSAEMLLARMLSDRGKKKQTWKAWYHMDLDLADVKFDIAHHGPANSSREWLEGNSLRYYTRDLVARHLKNQLKPPDVVLRGHYHDRKIEVWIEHTLDQTYWTWAAICPAYALFQDDYTMRATKSKPFMTAGTLAVEIIDGRVKDIHDWTHAVDIRKKEVIK